MTKAIRYSDEYLNYYADIYMTCDKLYKLAKRGIRFEAFLARPDMYLKLIKQTQEVQMLIDEKELEIEQLPGGGTRFGSFFQQVKQKRKMRHYKKNKASVTRIHA